MSLRIVLPLLLFMSSVACSSHTKDIGSTIGYQLHSWNDLREWKQTLMKGGLWFKIDTNYMNSSLCDSQSQAPHQHPLGCFVLVHDTPAANKTNYNTTDDLLTMLTDPDYRSYFAGLNRIYIALCFKTSFLPDVCDNSIASNNWIALVDELYQTANQIIQEFNLNVEFVLDGVGSPKGCLKGKWKDWVSTWISSGDTTMWGALFSNDAELGYDRYQILNQNAFTYSTSATEYNIRMVAATDYGKFSKQSKYPYLNWEPADQQSIVQVSSVYVDKGLIQEAGFKFAINSDPVQFEVYTASLTRRGWNNRLAQTANHTNPKIASVVYNNNYYAAIVSLVNVASQFQLWSTPTLYGDFAEISTWKLNQVTSTNSISHSYYLPDDTNYFFFSDPQGNYLLSALDFESLELTDVMYGTFSRQSNTFGSSMTTMNMGLYYLVASKVYQTDCGLAFDFMTLKKATQQDVEMVISGLCVAQAKVSSASVSIADLSTLSNPSKIGCDSSTNIVAAVAYTIGQTISYSVVCVNVGAHSAYTISNPKNVAMDVGNHPSISIQLYQDEIFFLEVHDTGFCWNTGHNNRNAYTYVCDLQPTPVEHILNYNYGSLLNLVDKIQNGTLLQPCLHNVMHGTYDMGDNPSVSLFTFTQDNQQKISMMEVHQGIPATAADLTDCGLPFPFDGHVLDAWNLTIHY